MIRFSNISLIRGTKVLLEGADAVLNPGDRIGLIGANGSGKSSLFALLMGELHTDKGDAEFPPQWRVAHVAQETPALDRPAVEYAIDGDTHLRALEKRLLQAEQANNGNLIGELYAALGDADAYTARPRAEQLLVGLGFNHEELELPVSSFSGGWRMRLNLAQALMCPSDLLLLDEPTNHLDLDAILWVEEWLKRYQGTLLVVSHDRDFLDGVVGAIVHVDSETLTTYAGNYSAFERQRAARLALQQSAYEKQQRKVAHLHAYIDRFRAKATKARQAQSRIKALERMELIAAAHVDTPFTFTFREPPERPRQLFSLESATMGYAGKPVLSKVEWSVHYGDAIGLLGPNGAGKSTLLKAIVGELPLQSGDLHRASGLRVGYFAQHQVDRLRLDESVLWHLARIAAGEREQELRNHLGGFDFRGDQVFQRVADLSGGEMARLALALIVWERPNLLLLDEPTNHLDIEMREALTEALLEFEGALVVIAHDRHLLRASVDQLWLVAHGGLAPFDGDLDDYRDWVLARRRMEASGETAAIDAAAPVPDRKAQKRTEAEARQKLAEARRPLEKRIAAIERELTPLQKEKGELETWLASTAAYDETNKAQLQEQVRRQGELATRIATLEEDWLWVSAELDSQRQAASVD